MGYYEGHVFVSAKSALVSLYCNTWLCYMRCIGEGRKTTPGGSRTHNPGNLGHGPNQLSHWVHQLGKATGGLYEAIFHPQGEGCKPTVHSSKLVGKSATSGEQ